MHNSNHAFVFARVLLLLQDLLNFAQKVGCQKGSVL